MNFKKVTCIGLGYVGLPTAVVLANKGIYVQGYDINIDAVEKINRGIASIEEKDLDVLLQKVTTAKKLVADTRIHAADAFLIAVPTPFLENKDPDMQYVVAAIKEIAKVAEKGNIIILESTSPVGAIEMIRDIIKSIRPDLFTEKDHILFAYCPERILPGNTIVELQENSRCIGGYTAAAAAAASKLYKIFCKGKMLITDARTAEMVKLGENSFRDINIAYANEMAKICLNNDVDVHEFIRIANYHPRVNILSPGIGVGGHCIPVDPWFLIAHNKSEAKILKQARDINDSMPAYYKNMIKEKLLLKKNAKVTVLGLTYKPNVDDFRCSPSLDLLSLLARDGDFTVYTHDPFLECLADKNKISNVHYHNDLYTACDNADLIIIGTPHQCYYTMDLSLIKNSLLIDPSGCLANKTQECRKKENQNNSVKEAA